MRVSSSTLIKQLFIEFVNVGEYLPEAGNALLALFPVGSLLTVFVKTVFNVIQWGKLRLVFLGTQFGSVPGKQVVFTLTCGGKFG